MLLRRLKARLGKPKIQYILTSATLGSEDDNESVAAFAENLCDSPFYADDIIRAKRIRLEQPSECSAVPESFYRTVAQLITDDASEERISKAIQAIYPDAPDDHSLGCACE